MDGIMEQLLSFMDTCKVLHAIGNVSISIWVNVCPHIIGPIVSFNSNCSCLFELQIATSKPITTVAPMMKPINKTPKVIEYNSKKPWALQY